MSIKNLCLTTSKKLQPVAIGPSETTPAVQRQPLTPKVVTDGAALTPFGSRFDRNLSSGGVAALNHGVAALNLRLLALNPYRDDYLPTTGVAGNEPLTLLRSLSFFFDHFSSVTLLHALFFGHSSPVTSLLSQITRLTPSSSAPSTYSARSGCFSRCR